MAVSEAIRLTEDVMEIAGQLEDELAQERPRREVFQELFTLRRSVERLEQQVRDTETDTVGGAC